MPRWAAAAAWWVCVVVAVAVVAAAAERSPPGDPAKLTVTPLMDMVAAVAEDPLLGELEKLVVMHPTRDVIEPPTGLLKETEAEKLELEALDAVIRRLHARKQRSEDRIVDLRRRLRRLEAVLRLAQPEEDQLRSDTEAARLALHRGTLRQLEDELGKVASHLPLILTIHRKHAKSTAVLPVPRQYEDKLDLVYPQPFAVAKLGLEGAHEESSKVA